MSKLFITDRDMEDLAHRGIHTLALDDDLVLTDLAHEKARQLGIRLVCPSSENPPCAPIRPYLSKTTVAADPPAASFDNPVSSRGDRNRLRFTTRTGETELRAAIIETGQLAYAGGLMISNDGNISVRMADGNLLITPSGVAKGRIGPDDLLVIDLQGNLVKPASDPSLKPTSEQPMHLEVYRQRPDVRAVIHTHLIFANALVISKGQIRMDVIPEAAASFGSIPVTDYAMPSSVQNAEAIRELIKTHDVVLIRNHGCLAVGHDLDEALVRVERLEHISKTLTFAELLGSVTPLPPEMLYAISHPAVPQH